MKLFPFDQLDQINDGGAVGGAVIVQAPGYAPAWYMTAVPLDPPTRENESLYALAASMTAQGAARELCDAGWRERFEALMREVGKDS